MIDVRLILTVENVGESEERDEGNHYLPRCRRSRLRTPDNCWDELEDATGKTPVEDDLTTVDDSDDK